VADNERGKQGAGGDRKYRRGESAVTERRKRVFGPAWTNGGDLQNAIRRIGRFPEKKSCRTSKRTLQRKEPSVKRSISATYTHQSRSSRGKTFLQSWAAGGHLKILAHKRSAEKKGALAGGGKGLVTFSGRGEPLLLNTGGSPEKVPLVATKKRNRRGYGKNGQEGTRGKDEEGLLSCALRESCGPRYRQRENLFPCPGGKSNDPRKGRQVDAGKRRKKPIEGHTPEKSVRYRGEKEKGSWKAGGEKDLLLGGLVTANGGNGNSPWRGLPAPRG